MKHVVSYPILRAQMLITTCWGAEPERRCPCCNSLIGPSEVVVSLDNGAISVGWTNGSVHLPPNIAKVAYILARKMPIAARRDEIIIEIWGGQEPEFSEKNLHVLLHNLRRRIANLGLSVLNIPGVGYKLVRNDEPSHAR